MQTEECDVLVIGSGAAGLAAAARLKAEGVEDVLVLTESLRGGTSINTGSDKQTYYKLSLCGDAQDSPMAMTQTYFDGGAMHGDIALVEAALSARCFSHLCDIGVPFPHDAFGQYAGYKTDHDPARRATSVGPYTSREMCLRLLDECRMRGVRFAEWYVAVELLTEPVVCTAGAQSRPLTCTGAVAVATSGGAWPLAAPVAPASGGAWPLAMRILARDTVFAVGGPGGLYARSVYPACHTGGIGLAIAAGARARNLPISQFGLASIKFRWNVSGTYMQVLPRLISTAADGVSDPRDFLLPAYGGDPAAAASTLFLKGYQWPFDPAKAESGSSRIDLLVREETLVRGRRVFLDYRSETPGLDLAALSTEARDYLEKSGALEGPPIARLERMNPGAIALYREHGIDLAGKPLEIALCAQHNNGGLAADAWWQSENVAHLWPIGEVNGSHGLRRPGGAALNAGQVGAYRCAAAIAMARRAAARRESALAASAAPASGGAWPLAAPVAPDSGGARPLAASAAPASGGAWPLAAPVAPTSGGARALTAHILRGTRDWRADRAALQARMDAAAGPVRDAATLARAAEEARAQLAAIRAEGFAPPATAREAAEALRTESLCLASVAYLEACLFAEQHPITKDTVLETELIPHPDSQALTSSIAPASGGARALTAHTLRPVRPIPHPDDWFENVWRDYREGKIFAQPKAIDSHRQQSAAIEK